MPEKQRRGAHALPKISEEMKQWSAMLGNELSGWPKVSSKPMFGMTAYYRGENIFAVLPKTRGFQSSKGIAFRFESISEKLAVELKGDARVISNPIGKKWITFEVENAKDVNAALEWLIRAYELSRSTEAKSGKVGFQSKKQGAKAKPTRTR
jgi:hypothetical protein